MGESASHPLTNAKIATATGLCGITGVGLAVMTLPVPATGPQFWLGLIVAFLGPAGGVWLFWGVLFTRTTYAVVAWISIVVGFYAVLSIGYKTWRISDQDSNYAYIDFPPDSVANIQKNSAWIKNSGSIAIHDVNIGIQRLTNPVFLKQFTFPIVYQDGAPLLETVGPVNVRLGLEPGEYNIAIRDDKHAYLEQLIVELTGGVYTRKIYVWPHVKGDETAGVIYPIYEFGHKD